MKNKNGFSVIEVMLAIGLLSLISGALVTMVTNQNRMIKYMSQKIAINDLKNGLIVAMQNENACAVNLSPVENSGLIFDSSFQGKKSLSLNKVRVSQDPASPSLIEVNKEVVGSSGLTVTSITLDDLTDVGSGQWSGIWKVGLTTASDGFSLKPITLVPQRFDVDVTTPTASKITACHAISGGGGGGSQWVDVGPNSINYPSGTVGIDTVTPGAALDVNGTTRYLASLERSAPSVNTGEAYTIPDIKRSVYQLRLDQDATITLPSTSELAVNDVYTLTIKLQQDAVGGRKVTWVGGGNVIRWDAGNVPALAMSPNRETIVQFKFWGGASAWLGAPVMKEPETFQVFPHIGAGGQTFTVPDGITSMRVRAWGGGGGGGYNTSLSGSTSLQGGDGGGAGFVDTTIPVTPGELLLIEVASGGKSFFGGTFGGAKAGDYGAGGGGGASSVVRGAVRLVTAGGGGGGGSAYNGSLRGGWGGAGGFRGGDAGIGYTTDTPATGANSNLSGGAGAVTTSAGSTNGFPGTLGYGGGGTAGNSRHGGGGGGGYYGGGGGCGAWSGASGAGGGGGSSYVAVIGAPFRYVTGAGRSPGGMNDPYYKPGVGVGGAGTGLHNETAVNIGGDGQIVLSW
ncbi:MAG: prepilin-type N-terminal cleavage/methylation domain-containing protein [Bdellovibrionaceae bacterium]|nr:prepilin-type N-terminal cleavage/methylation domain-containing protein [Pseudobdellovibrionaceae bacterium]